MVGSAIVRELERQGYANIITRTHKGAGSYAPGSCRKNFADEKPEYVFPGGCEGGRYRGK